MLGSAMQVENATAQLKDADSANEELQEELTLSKEEVERLIRYLWPTGWAALARNPLMLAFCHFAPQRQGEPR
jgi:transcription initiation factor IIE alpha subunit